jgi:hypothetical protein
MFAKQLSTLSYMIKHCTQINKPDKSIKSSQVIVKNILEQVTKANLLPKRMKQAKQMHQQAHKK